MYERRYGLIRTLAPLHVGASEGEEAGNLNLIFRDPFTQTGIIPGSSIRGRFRAEMRSTKEDCEHWYGKAAGDTDISEGRVKFEYASLLWLPVFCPGQPIVWVSCPRLLKRYAAMAQPEWMSELPAPYTCSEQLQARKNHKERTLFFNLGFMKVTPVPDLHTWIPAPLRSELPADRLVVVADADIGMIHDMALYRQSRVKLADTMKKVDGGAFFNVEALPEGSMLVFPIALKPDETQSWQPFGKEASQELYFGGLESIGFGRCSVTLLSGPTAPALAEVA
ncbi:MAG: RAMP superfamily CRISPR-associated protein [Cyanobacteriota bacterium]